MKSLELELLKEHCKFKSEYDVYILLAVARKKDHPDITNSQEIVFREVIKTEKDIERKYNKIHALTRNYMDGKYSFYVYITTNPRDIRKAFFLLHAQFTSMLSEFLCSGVVDVISKKFKRINELWISCLMKPGCRGSSKNFMIDLDDSKKLGEVCEELRKLTEVIRVTKSKNGYHIIVKPFNRTLMPKIEGMELQTDSITFVEYIVGGK